jgi:hypothetical protein
MVTQLRVNLLSDRRPAARSQVHFRLPPAWCAGLRSHLILSTDASLAGIIGVCETSVSRYDHSVDEQAWARSPTLAAMVRNTLPSIHFD